ncbi:Heterokaryon incompatibility protein [Neofusicoccum parvum]|uniref:Heterokaryon incompatibility protein n=1 Tax=Neofusicoccum parvum TaxID=310453 RepID=A0ACB5RZB9_9PEZI|nr:Heterokaryon incompatibility protein [Neofusicoccum parvum]
MTPNSYYPYQPLESESHIRLLKVTKRVDSPSRRGGLRRWSFSLVHVSLNNAPPFETVSYAWVNTARPFSLPVEDAKDIAITKSVFDALPYLIQRSETGFLWLDQICINQDNKDERGHQVSLMGRVFTTSRRTIV